MSLSGALLQKRPMILGSSMCSNPFFTFVNICFLLYCAVELMFENLYYGVATVSRLLEIMGLFCRIQSLL